MRVLGIHAGFGDSSVADIAPVTRREELAAGADHARDLAEAPRSIVCLAA